MGRIKANRNQQGAHFPFKIRANPTALGRIALPMRNNANAVTRKLRQQVVVVEQVLACNHVVRDSRKRFKRLHTVWAL